jgi:predicted nucleic acid-binding protein
MIQVVADATLLRYLIEIQAIDVLPGLFGRIITPPAVIQDLQHINTPVPVRTWIASPPPWVVVQAPSSAADPGLSRLGAGEREAILLAHEHQPALLVTDDRRARRVAETRGLRVVGTVWVLERAAERGLVDLPPMLTRLLTTNIRLHLDVIQNALARDAARKRAAQEESTDPQGM